MAGAGKKRQQEARKASHKTEDPSQIESSEQGNDQEHKFAGGYDGPADAPSDAGSRSNPFGPGLGFDPAKPQTTNSDVPRNLELPAAAYATTNEIPNNLPLRPKDMNTTGKAVTVRVNQFKVVKWPQKTVYQYDVLIGSGNEKRGLIKAVWHSQAIQAALKQVGPMWLFDGQRIAWCSAKAPRGELRIMVDLDKEKGKLPRKDSNGNNLDNRVRVAVKASAEINMAVISGYLERKMAFDNSILEAINFLDHAMRQFPSEFYSQIKRSFFGRGNQRFPLDNCIEAMKGVYSSMRLCQPMPNISGAFSTGLAVNVDVANGIFWASQALHQAARNFCRDRNPRMDWLVFNRLLKPTKDSRIGWTMSPDFKELRKLVKLKFAVKHRGKDGSNKTYTIKGFHFDPKFGAEGAHSKNVTFKMKDGTTTSVYDYFQKQYNVELEFHYLPLVLTTKDGMFPMEVCTIMPNQRYVFKTSPEQTANMIKFAVTRPKQRIEAIQQGVKMLKWNEDPYFMHYGIEIDPSMTITNARLLPNPEIQYAGSKVNPGISGRWDLRGKKFLKANPSPLVSWGVAIMDNSTDNTTVQNFLKVFVNTYITHGGQVQNRQPVIHCAGKGELIPNVVTTLRNLVGAQCKREAQILLFILRDKNSVTYERLKKSLDCRYGLVSQMMQSVHVQKAQPQYCSNVCMKLNAKLGGTTCKSVPTAASKGPPSFFKVPTLIIGADVSHPSPGSPQASMAAITMSMDKDACRYAAAVQTNGIRVEMIHDANLASMIIPLLENWIKNVGNGQGPQHIYYFRDGVSEGQYLHVLDEEVVNMRAAIKKKFGPVKIKFTVVIASKRHHIRIFPKENDSVAGDRNANPHPGTLVERDVTHPFEYDFYLNSHSAIQGTARPVHYHVLLDEMGVPANILQSMIYQHCYQYMRSTTPVSLHPAVYYAHLASNRARAHEDVASSEGPRGGQKFVEMVQAQAGKPRAVTVESDKITESKPLVELGSGASDEVKAAIKVSMWYI